MKYPRTTSLSAPPPDQAELAAPEAKVEAAPLSPPLWRETAPIVVGVLAALDIIETAPRPAPQ